MRRLSISTVITMAAVASAFTLTFAASAAKIGYIGATANQTQAFDVGWRNRLTSQGHTVTQFAATNAANDATLATMDLLIVSSDVSSAVYLTGIGINQPRPIITYEYGLYDELFGGAGNNTTPGAGDNITILQPASPLAAGLSGNVAYYSGNGDCSRMSFTPISAGSQIIASSTTNGALAVMMLLEAGAQGGTGAGGQGIAPARRIGVPCYANWNPANVTADGWKILDGAVAYALGLSNLFWMDTLRVEAAADGSANAAVPAQTVATGRSITNYAIARNGGSVFLTNTPASWVLTNITGGVVSGDLVASADKKSAIFTAHLAGSARILAGGNATNLVPSGVITVAVGPATQVLVETAANGNGTVVDAQTLTTGESITAYAVARDAGGNFVTNTPASWVLTNITGGVVSGDLVASADTKSAVFTAHATGSAEILAVGNVANLVPSGVITVEPATPPVSGVVVLSEFLAANSSGLADEDGERSDWIELYNSGPVTVDLLGWHLTDDSNDLAKWTFPQVSLPSGAYLVVFASDKNRAPSAGQLHTNFKLTSSGEYLALVQSNGTTIEWEYAPVFPVQSPNVSYGINLSSGAEQYYTTPTPGAPNHAGLVDVLAPVTVSPARGFYDTPFQVTLACTSPGVTIRYTLDGSPPTASVGTIYSSSIPINTTTVLRALAYRSGYLSQPVVTHTYIFPAHVLNQSTNPPGYPSMWGSVPAVYGMYPGYPDSDATLRQSLLGLPSVCIAGRIDDIFGATAGYYCHGGRNNNESWQKPGSIELIYPDGDEGFQVNAGFQGRADNVTAARERGLKVEFKSIYGPSKLKFPGLFDGAKEGRETASDEFDALILRPGKAENYTATGYNPVLNIYFRDIMVRDAELAITGYGSRNIFVHLYLNGIYWGVYDLTEVYGPDYYVNYFGGGEDDWFDVRTKDSSQRDGKNGVYDPTDVVGTNRYLTFLNFMDTADLSQYTNYLRAARDIHPLHFAEYIIYYSYYGVGDWPDNNWNFAMKNGPNPEPGFFHSWDAEKTWFENDDPQSYKCARYSPYLQSLNNPEGTNYHPVINRIWEGLIKNAEFRMLFADRSYELMHNGGLLTDENRVQRFMYYVDLLNLPIRIDQRRWSADNRRSRQPGVLFTYTNVQTEINRVLSNTVDNVSKYIASFRAKQLYPSIDPPLIAVTGSNATATTCTLSGGSGNLVYYTTNNVDPRLIGGGVAPGAWSFAGGSAVNVSLPGTSVVKARSWQAGEWSALNQLAVSRPSLRQLIFSEIMYNPPMFNGVDGDAFEFVELKNVGPVPVNLRGMTFTRGLTFTFNTDLVLAPGAFAVLVADAARFASKYPGVPIAGVFAGSNLANDGETLELRDVAGAVVARASYNDKSPWPELADNGGHSLVPINTTDEFDGSDPSLWRASRNVGGSPGTDDPPPVPDVVISEILAHTDPPQTEKDSLELHNAGPQPVNVSGWSLTDDRDVPAKFVIPAGTPPIASGGYLVFDADDFNPAPGVPPSFGLSSLGESIYLFTPDGGGWRLIHEVEYRASANGVSFGLHTLSTGGLRHPAQTSVSLGMKNSGPRIGPVVINEIMYHPLFPAGTEFIELLNVSTSSVALFDPANPGNTWRINGASFQFPTNVTLGTNQFLLVVDTNPAQFRTNYGIPAAVQIFGPMGRLADAGETLELQRPDSPQLDPITGLTYAPYITVDEVGYRNASPWPTQPAGTGAALARISPLAFGDDPINWASATPTPGAGNVVDTDADGLPDDVELRYGLNPTSSADARLDQDGDGRTNLEEWRSGTALNDPTDVISFDISHSSPDRIELAFPAKPGRRYQVQVSERPGGAGWTAAQEICPVRSGRVRVEQTLSVKAARFYRLAVLPPL